LDFTKNAGNIVNDLDNSELQYVAQNINRIINEINKRFAVGLTSGKLSEKSITTIIRRLKQEDENSVQIRNGIQVPVEKIEQEPTDDFTTPKTSRKKSAVIDDDEEISMEDLKQKFIALGGKKQGLNNIKRETLIRKIEELQQQKKTPKTTDTPSKSPALIDELKEKLSKRTPSGTGIKKKTKNIIMGSGLAKPKVKVTPENIDMSLGVQPVKSYVPLGKYLLNKTKLADNVLMIKHIKGGAVGQLPTIHISNKLVDVLKHLITSQLPPDFDTLNGLDDKEKKLLHKIAKSTQILERFSIPNPNLSQEQRDINRFEILRGEMNAGNDSKELVKEFKLLLLKLMNAGKIPRREGQEILTDFIALGY
jgi:hypothetical protein